MTQSELSHVLAFWVLVLLLVLVNARARCGEGMSKEMRLRAFAGSSGAAVFHSVEAATGKGRSPAIDRRARPTTSDDDEAERFGLRLGLSI